MFATCFRIGTKFFYSASKLLTNISFQILRIHAIQDRKDCSAVRDTQDQQNFGQYENEGILAQSEVLKANTTLVALDLASNSFGKEGALELSEVLRINTSLIRVSLWGNPIGDGGVFELSEILKLNTTLNELNIGNSSRPMTLSEALKVNIALKTGLAD
ncbi:hypothetical protein BCR41DRAFT_394877 [Lobosporangium transversale]|uniref:Uncharacterized protein n=1 Tax=Lobosporangium transversale TaxID=64571 RepID=A0A1Y2GS43_9FUNG|nr:hypothetical protein BCR41DRAFT_394877 [Lobosporangium transversale]ORZ20967.1 hypothetical protein BCR41DRAFT_394877 [Lobosporangium transversale]|eukprot:XP_021882876.1 hypothetical protein BCR41DRAFT_394877 [Lobosporangium transversale]